MSKIIFRIPAPIPVPYLFHGGVNSIVENEITSAHQNYENELFRRALYKTNNVDVSQDLVQATFLKTLLYLQKGGKIDFMRSFLNHVLSDLVIDEYRKHKTTSLDLLLENGYEPGIDGSQRSGDVIDSKAAVQLIAHLPPKYKHIITLRYLQELSLKEIAAVTMQSENTVAVQVHRGIQKLQLMQQKGIKKADLLRIKNNYD